MLSDIQDSGNPAELSESFRHKVAIKCRAWQFCCFQPPDIDRFIDLPLERSGQPEDGAVVLSSGMTSASAIHMNRYKFHKLELHQHMFLFIYSSSWWLTYSCGFLFHFKELQETYRLNLFVTYLSAVQCTIRWLFTYNLSIFNYHGIITITVTILVIVIIVIWNKNFSHHKIYKFDKNFVKSTCPTSSFTCARLLGNWKCWALNLYIINTTWGRL